jgi:hypothetical protein
MFGRLKRYIVKKNIKPQAPPISPPKLHKTLFYTPEGRLKAWVVGNSRLMGHYLLSPISGFEMSEGRKQDYARKG